MFCEAWPTARRTGSSPCSPGGRGRWRPSPRVSASLPAVCGAQYNCSATTHLVLYSGKNLDTITQGDADENFGFIEQDLDRLAAASCFAELVDRLTMERQPQPKLFQLLLSAMRALEEADPELLGRVFEVKLMAALGYQPQFDGCVMGCGDGRRALQPEVAAAGPVRFSIERGGVLCPACAANCPEALALSPRPWLPCAYFLRAPLGPGCARPDRTAYRLELASFLHSFICYHGDVKPRSWQFARWLPALMPPASIEVRGHTPQGNVPMR